MRDIMLCNSLEKVFPRKRPCPQSSGLITEQTVITVFEGTIPAVQLVYCCEEDLTISVSGAPSEAIFRSVELIPVDLPCYEKTDSAYLATEPGLFPDLLKPLAGGAYGTCCTVKSVKDEYRAVWIDFPGIRAEQAGMYAITVKAEAGKDFYKEFHFSMDVRPQALPPASLLHTQWFHTDCLASYYKAEVFSETHWKIIEAFMRPLVPLYGINVLLTPVFTPPLDTEPGRERPTVQLAGIEKDGGSYTFNFEKLDRWCALCKKHGISHIEIPHFFTQWGAAFTPKITAKIDGKETRIAGWNVKADDPAYGEFLKQFIPALRKALEENGYGKDRVIFHVSDEPGADHKENYKRAKSIIAPLVEGSLTIDALSGIAFYREGIVEHPVPPVNHAAPFLEARVPDLWVYYCCSQNYKVPNRFFAMPSTRTRAMGILMYYFEIKGFLQWGYNFYYSQNSKELIDPFTEASGIRAWPAGDPFLVYPGEDGTPLSSLRAETHRESLEDFRLLTLVEKKRGRQTAVSLLKEDFPGPLDFENYPLESGYYYRLREKAALAL